MNNVDTEVLEQLLAWLKTNQHCFLCTLVKTWGSSPRPAGSLLACTRDGQTIGSLSGGCVEENLVEQLKTGELAQHKPAYLQYGLTQEDTEHLGLPCGGQLYVLTEPLMPDAQRIAEFTTLTERVRNRQCMLRTLNVASGLVTLAETEQVLPLEYDETSADSPVLKHWYGPRHQLFIIGAGMVSMYLADMALKLDYKVLVCDPRPELLAAWKIAGTRNLCMYPDDAIRTTAQDPMTAIVALTHDPKIDDMGMMEALTTKAFYVGAMGSKKTSAKRKERLRELGISETQLASLKAPVGLPIGSKTPPEIALSILAEITMVRQALSS